MNEISGDPKTRYAIERAFIALAAALHDIPDDILSMHAIPASGIIGFRNILAHSYINILDELLILTIQDDLPALDQALLELQQSIGKRP